MAVVTALAVIFNVMFYIVVCILIVYEKRKYVLLIKVAFGYPGKKQHRQIQRADVIQFVTQILDNHFYC